jgi:hypothetical protein
MSWITIAILAAVAAVVFGLAIAGMAIGVMFSGRRIQGSCGGLSTMRGGDGRSSCMACGGSPENCNDARIAECDEEHARSEAAQSHAS